VVQLRLAVGILVTKVGASRQGCTYSGRTVVAIGFLGSDEEGGTFGLGRTRF
jgi:hypothetical protein